METGVQANECLNMWPVPLYQFLANYKGVALAAFCKFFGPRHFRKRLGTSRTLFIIQCFSEGYISASYGTGTNIGGLVPPYALFRMKEEGKERKGEEGRGEKPLLGKVEEGRKAFDFFALGIYVASGHNSKEHNVPLFRSSFPSYLTYTPRED